MDAGVPITDPVAGISIGLVKEGDRYVLLTDIMGDEDHFGDMDFKVAGTGRGITGIQLDLKIDGINEEIIRRRSTRPAKPAARSSSTMLATLRQPRDEISKYAPRLLHDQDQPREDRPADRPRRQEHQGHPGSDRRQDRHRGRRHRVHLAQRRRRRRGRQAARSRR